MSTLLLVAKIVAYLTVMELEIILIYGKQVDSLELGGLELYHYEHPWSRCT